MSYTLDQFAAECRRILAADPGPAGRKRLCALVGEVCRDEAFVAEYLGDDVSERDILYEDPVLGFCILGHVDHLTRQSEPHDHGQRWPGESGQRDKWIFCLNGGKDGRGSGERDDATGTPESHTGLQGEGGAGRHQG